MPDLSMMPIGESGSPGMPSLPTLMSSTNLATNMSSTNFQFILDAALDSYFKQTGIDLTKHPSAEKLQSCRSSDDVLQILSERESAFNDYRDKYRNLIGHLRPVVQVTHAFSAVLGQAGSLVSSSSVFSLSDRISDYLYANQQVPFQPTNAIFVGVDVLLSVHIPLPFSMHPYLTLIYVRLPLTSVQAMMRLLTSLNASQIS
jgi:fungal STAND N-terminal Goodbye domain